MARWICVLQRHSIDRHPKVQLLLAAVASTQQRQSYERGRPCVRHVAGAWTESVQLIHVATVARRHWCSSHRLLSARPEARVQLRSCGGRRRV